MNDIDKVVTRLIFVCLLFLGLVAAAFLALTWTMNGTTNGNVVIGNRLSGTPMLLVIIEFKQGEVRSGVSLKGERWEQEMHCHYGYFSTIKGKDGEPLDVYVNPDTSSTKIFRITQLNVLTKEFDEYKIMLGFNTIEQAKQMYLSHFTDDWAGYGGIEEISSCQLRNE